VDIRYRSDGADGRVASIFKRVSEPVAAGKYGPGLVDLAQTYKVSQV
jgi:hypothetical protein